jgi:hypothetical protein
MTRRKLVALIMFAALIAVAAVAAITDGTSNTRIPSALVGATASSISIVKVLDKSTPVLVS